MTLPNTVNSDSDIQADQLTTDVNGGQNGPDQIVNFSVQPTVIVQPAPPPAIAQSFTFPSSPQ